MGSDSATQSNGGSTPRRTRRRFSRTFSRERFGEYRSLLRTALSEEYRVVALEDFLLDPAARTAERTLVLRHDVDQHPASALELARIERELGVRSTWYLRWRTADPAVVTALRESGASIGLHYETLTRHVLAGETPSDALLGRCREELRGEIGSFAERFGAAATVCAHGDSRAPGVRNLTLLEGERLDGYGIRADANLEMRRHRLDVWLTDRSAAEGGWSDGRDPRALLLAHVGRIQCLTHPNNWVSGPELWRDRMLAAALPSPSPGATMRVIRTRPDAPPVPA